MSQRKFGLEKWIENKISQFVSEAKAKGICITKQIKNRHGGGNLLIYPNGTYEVHYEKPVLKKAQINAETEQA